MFKTPTNVCNWTQVNNINQDGLIEDFAPVKGDNEASEEGDGDAKVGTAPHPVWEGEGDDADEGYVCEAVQENHAVHQRVVLHRASNEPLHWTIGVVFTIMENAHTRIFLSWFKAPASAVTFKKTLC